MDWLRIGLFASLTLLLAGCPTGPPDADDDDDDNDDAADDDTTAPEPDPPAPFALLGLYTSEG